jgi:dienelactone hydrolase
MRPWRRLVLVLLVVAAVLFAARVALRPWVRATSLIVRTAGLEKQHPTLAALQTSMVAEWKETVPSRFGPLRARVYRPTNGPRQAVLLTPGVNALGIDEPRLMAFARNLAASGLLVLTPELPDLSRYLVTPRSTDMVEDAALWFARNEALTAGKPFGIVGISFAGGLSLVAAGRPSLRGHVAFVFSFGGHANFQRVVHYLCTGEAPPPPPGVTLPPTPPPHDYGVAILALDLAGRLVPPEQVEGLRTGILAFLHASHVALFDQPRAEREFAHARSMEAPLPEPARTILNLVNTRRASVLGARLLPHARALGDLPALSPDQSPAPGAPVFLLHGNEDNVVPAVETALLAERLRPRTPVHVILTPLISHAEVDRPAGAGEVVALIRFFRTMLG